MAAFIEPTSSDALIYKSYLDKPLSDMGIFECSSWQRYLFDHMPLLSPPNLWDKGFQTRHPTETTKSENM